MCHFYTPWETSENIWFLLFREVQKLITGLKWINLEVLNSWPEKHIFLGVIHLVRMQNFPKN